MTTIGTFEELLLVETDDCVIWPHSKDAGGYGQLHTPGPHATRRRLMTHREAAIRRLGDPPRLGLYACHSCHVPPCMNYRHLRWDTPVNNTADRIADETGMFGEDNPRARLTWGEVRLIRDEHGAGKSLAGIARDRSLVVSHVWKIVHHLIWKPERCPS